MIRYEAHALANRLLGKNDLPRVVETEQLWTEDNPGAVLDADDRPLLADEEMHEGDAEAGAEPVAGATAAE